MKVAPLILTIQFFIFFTFIFVNFNKVKEDPIFLLQYYALSLIITSLITMIYLMIFKVYEIPRESTIDLVDSNNLS